MSEQPTETQDLVQSILNKYGKLMEGRFNYAIEWQELADYILPRKNSILVQRIPGWKRTQRLYDSTAPDNADKLAASIHSTLTPSFTRWFHLELEDQELNRNYEVKNWLDLVTTKINNALNKSNFNSEAHENFIDLIVFGTGCLYQDEKPGGWWGGFQFTSIPPGKYCVSEGPDGRVDTVYRAFPMPIHAVMQMWPNDIPDEIKETSKEKPDELIEIIHAVYPNEKSTIKEFRWDSCYLLYKYRHLLSKKGYFNFPFLVSRWTKNSDEMYGRGPSHTALPDIRTLNKLTEMELRNLAKVVDPPLGAVSDDVIGSARMIPGGITSVLNKDAIFKIDTSGDYRISNLTKQGLQSSIEKLYYIDQLQLKDGPQMTAAEVNARLELMQRILGPVLGRLEAEFTKPLLNRSFYLMNKAGLFNPIPQALMQNIKGPVLIKIQYLGSLARAQRASDINALQQFQQLIIPTLQANPDSAQVIDFDEVVRYTGATLDIPAKVIRDKKAVDLIRQEHQKAMEQQQQIEQAGKLGEMAKSVAPLLRVAGERPKPGSPLQKVA
jgi:hypothetical protein